MRSVFAGRVQELFESPGGRPGLPVSTNGFCGRKATMIQSKSLLRSCVKVEVAVLAFPSLINLMVSADVKQH